MRLHGDGNQERVRAQLCEAIAMNARDARRAVQLTQEDVGDLIGVTSEFYARIERGHVLPSVTTLRKLVDVLGIEANVLLGVDPPRKRRRARRRRTPSTSDAYTSSSPEMRKLMRRLRKAHPDTLKMIDRLLRDFERVSETVSGE